MDDETLDALAHMQRIITNHAARADVTDLAVAAMLSITTKQSKALAEIHDLVQELLTATGLR